MPLEAVCVVLDNSEFNRNGDFAPSRWESQEQAATNICDVKLQQNRENTVGVMSQAGNRVELHISNTNEIGEILTSIAQIQIQGNGNFMTAVKVAALSLKHRTNKNAKPRIVIFCGHPLEEDQADYERLGKRLRQNNVAIDIINFANPDNVPKLKALVDNANKNDNSNFLDVPLGVSQLSDVLFTSPILMGEQMAGAAEGAPADGSGGMVTDIANGGQGAMGQFGDLDPELEQALRLSMEIERARQNEETKKDGDGTGAGETAGATAAPANPAPAAANEDGDDSHDEEYYIEQAKKLSLQDGVPDPSAGTDPAPAEEPKQPDVNVQDVVNTDFMKGLVDELGLDLNQEDFLAGQPAAEENKQGEEEKKDENADGKKDNNAGGGGAQGQ